MPQRSIDQAMQLAVKHLKASRLAEAEQLSNLKLTELAADSPEKFVKIAVQLANDRLRLSQLRSTLRQRMEQSPLMDAKRFAHDVEAAYRQRWHNWCSPS